MEPKSKINSVFGVTRLNSAPLHYVEREGVDDLFIDSINSNKHIVVYGSLKQGKTSLIKKHLQSSEVRTIYCKNIIGISDLYTSLLKEIGYEIEYNSEYTNRKSEKNSFGFKLSAIFTGSMDISSDKENLTRKSKRPIEFNINDVTDVIRALNSMNEITYIILEDFHYLKDEIQKEFSLHLKLFCEKSNVNFIITGVWMSDDKFSQLNRELKGQIVNINADLWKENELKKIIENGEDILKIRLSESEKNSIVSTSLGSIAILQELCLLIYGQGETYSENKMLKNNEIHTYQLVSPLLKNYESAFIDFINKVIHLDDNLKIEYYKVIIYCILTTRSEILRYGLEIDEIYRICKEALPLKDISKLELHNELIQIKDFQVSNKIIPPFVDYDESEKLLHITDKYFLLWLASNEKSNLLNDANFEIEWTLRSKWLKI